MLNAPLALCVLIALAAGSIPAYAEPKFFIITELGNSFPVIMPDWPVLDTLIIEPIPGRDPDSPDTGAAFRSFVHSQSKMISQELRGWIITGTGCDSILVRPEPRIDGPDCPIHPIMPYMKVDMEWDYVSSFLEDTVTDRVPLVRPFAYHTAKDWNVTIADPRPPTGGRLAETELHLFDEVIDRDGKSVILRESTSAGGTISPDDVRLFIPDSQYRKPFKTTDALRIAAYVGQTHDNARSEIAALGFRNNDGTPSDEKYEIFHGTVSVSGSIADGIILRVVEFPHKIGYNHGFYSGYDVERLPPFIGPTNFFFMESITAHHHTYIVIELPADFEADGSWPVTLHASRGISYILLDHDETRPFSFVFGTLGDFYAFQHAGYCGDSAGPVQYVDGCKTVPLGKRIESSYPVTFFGTNQTQPVMYVDFDPIFTDIVIPERNIVFDHVNEEVLYHETGSGDEHLINAYSYVRIPIGSFGAVNISSVGLEGLDGTFQRLAYLEGLYDPLNEHMEFAGQEGYYADADAQYLHVPIIPKYKSLTMTVGTIPVRYNFADLPFDQFTIADLKRADSNAYIGSSMEQFGHDPRHNTIYRSGATATIIKPMVADRDGDARVRVELAVLADGYVRNSKLLYHQDTRPQDRTGAPPGIGGLDYNHHTSVKESVRLAKPLNVEITTFVNGKMHEAELFENPHRFVLDAEPAAVQCGQHADIPGGFHCEMTYDMIRGKIDGQVITVPGIRTGDYVEFMIAAELRMEAENVLPGSYVDDPVATWNGGNTAPGGWMLGHQWAESKATIDIRNPFIATQIR